MTITILTCEVLKQFNCCGMQQDNTDGNYPCDVCHSVEASQQSAEYAEFDFFEEMK